MKFSLTCFVFMLSISVQAQTIELPVETADFFRHAYYKWQRDSTLLKKSLQREDTLVQAIASQGKQIQSYKKDSVTNTEIRKNLALERKAAVDSTASEGKLQLQAVKDRSKGKSWIIVGETALLILCFIALF